jgi:hypothetical protein
MTCTARVAERIRWGEPAGLAIWLTAREYHMSASALAVRLGRGRARRHGVPQARRVAVKEWWNK